MVCYKYNVFYVFYILAILVLGLLLGVESFTPPERLTHASALVGSKLYFFGGTNHVEFLNDVFYLDVSNTFNVSSPPWVNLTTIPFRSALATVTVRDVNNEPTIYLFGGYMLDIKTGEITSTPILHTLNLHTFEWNIPSISGTEPQKRKEMESVIDSNGKIYIFSGATDYSLNQTTNRVFNEMVILDTVGLTWSMGSTIDSPLGRIDYTATLLSNGVIVYIGGRVLEHDSDNYVDEADISQINLYDTISSKWSSTVRIFVSIKNNLFYIFTYI